MDFGSILSPENLARARENEEKERLAREAAAAPVAPAPVAPVNTAAPAAASAAPAADAPFVPQPVTTSATTSSTTSSTGTTGQTATPNEAGLIAERDRLLAEQEVAAAKAAEAGKAKAIEEQAKADEKAKLTLDKQQATDALVKQGEQVFAQRLAESNAQYENMKSKSEIKDFWAQKSTGEKIMAGFAVALGGIGAGMQGDKTNRALDLINKQIEQDFELQKQNFLNSKDVLAAARDQSEDARQGIQDKLNLLNLSKAAAYEVLGDKYAALAAKRGVAEADLAKDALLNDLRMKANATKLEYEKGLRKSVSESTQKAISTQTQTAMPKPESLTEEQAKTRGFLTRMLGGARDYDKVGGISGEAADAIRKHRIENAVLMEDGSGALKWMMKPGAAPLPPGLSEKDRLAWGAIEDFARASIRRESGAVIGASEFTDDINQILPTAEDTPALLEWKRKLMTRKIAGMRDSAGASYREPQESVSGNAAPAFPRTVRKNGKAATVSNAAQLKEAQAEGWQ
jgi:F0F1-type ATP synthase membrane subunit c/vacuolar-type H+-ATPase subunit K